MAIPCFLLDGALGTGFPLGARGLGFAFGAPFLVAEGARCFDGVLFIAIEGGRTLLGALIFVGLIVCPTTVGLLVALGDLFDGIRLVGVGEALAMGTRLKPPWQKQRVPILTLPAGHGLVICPGLIMGKRFSMGLTRGSTFRVVPLTLAAETGAAGRLTLVIVALGVDLGALICAINFFARERRLFAREVRAIENAKHWHNKIVTSSTTHNNLVAILANLRLDYLSLVPCVKTLVNGAAKLGF